MLNRPALNQRVLAKKFATDNGVKEAAVENPAMAFAKKLGYFHRKYKSPNRRSAPDRILISPFGVVLFIEFKRPKKWKLTPGQKTEIADMRTNGAIVYVINNLDTAKKVIAHHVVSRTVVRGATCERECPAIYAEGDAVGQDGIR